ncbi:hypothetical protein Tco_0247691 [Tanacetum coccineum]
MKLLQQQSDHEHTLILQMKRRFVNQLISRQQKLFCKVYLKTFTIWVIIIKMQSRFGIELSLQERESKLYDDFDTFTSMPGESIHSYYMQFSQLINDMHMIGMTMKPHQVNTKFVNHLQPEWSKFVTDVKLAKDMHTTNFDHLYAHIRQHKAHANEVRLQKQRYTDQIALVANSPSCLNPTQYYPQLTSAT